MIFSRKRQITVDGRTISVKPRHLTGQQLAALCAMPVGYRIAQEHDGRCDQLIGPFDVAEINGGERFVLLPPTNGG